jgi:hypothetical protein
MRSRDVSEVTVQYEMSGVYVQACDDGFVVVFHPEKASDGLLASNNPLHHHPCIWLMRTQHSEPVHPNHNNFLTAIEQPYADASSPH